MISGGRQKAHACRLQIVEPATPPAWMPPECKPECDIAGKRAAVNHFNMDQLIFALVVATVMIGLMLYRVLF